MVILVDDGYHLNFNTMNHDEIDENRN